MRKLADFCCLIGLSLLSAVVNAQQIQVDSLRFWTAPDYTRLVFDVSASPTHEVFTLENPDRLVIDIRNARLRRELSQPQTAHPFFSRVRIGTRNKQDLRIVLDLKGAVKPKSFILIPNESYGHRLVVDLSLQKSLTAKVSPPRQVKKSAAGKNRDIIIAIDAGHGGEDPGARGSRGTLEKQVVFRIAQKLERLVKKYPGMRPVMIRKGDYYVGLRKRMQIARQAKADLFVSIHADAFKNRKVKGASVFTLSRNGESSEAARWLAHHENASDLVGGVSLDDKDDVLASVLLDLSQTATQHVSQDVAVKVLRNFSKIGSLHSKTVQKAGFVVLKSPDIPSILVETAFISNPTEERNLRSSNHQQKIAIAIFNGILDYFQYNAPAGTRMAATKHIISRGETLSGIAQRYGVSTKSLQSVNSIHNSRIRVGQVLAIPTS